MELSHTIDVAAPIERLWDLTVDLEGLPAVTPTIAAVERLDGSGPVRVGTRARLRQPGLPPRVWTVEEVEAPTRFVWSTRLLVVRMTGIHELEALSPTSCRLRLALRLEGPGAGLLARLAGRKLESALATEAKGFHRAATATGA